MNPQADATGKPGTTPAWTSSNKNGVGTAYSGSSRVWYTLYRGHLTELYYPTIDTPQVRDVRLLITDGDTFLSDEADDDACNVQRMCPSLGFHVVREVKQHRYTLDKVIIADPHAPCVLQHVQIKGKSAAIKPLKLYIICEPRIGMAGAKNNAHVFKSAGRTVLVAESGNRWLAIVADCPFSQTSAGYAGVSDGVTDLRDGFKLRGNFIDAVDGNVVLTGEIELANYSEFTIGIAFGETRHSAVTTLLQSLATPFDQQQKDFVSQWERAVLPRRALEECAFDKGNLYRSSFSLLLAHEDKTYPGAQVASLSIPWGEARTDKDGEGGYHLVWTRDLANSATALLAAGQSQTPMRTLIYLAVAQLPDGGFSQNLWVDGRPFRDNTQLDEVAFPILLARRLHIEGVCKGFDAGDMVRKAARFLVLHGPITEQERWEESSGYSPSTLAALITACVCAASFALESGDSPGAKFVLDYADWLHSHIFDWTVTQTGTLLQGVTRHFVRLNPAEPGSAVKVGDVDQAQLKLTGQAPGHREFFPANEVVDAGFLELVRNGILQADDSVVIDSLRVVDHSLRIETTNGTSWRRYNHDGYGQREDGSAFDKYGIGRAWPLLTGERGHYELIAGRDPVEAIRAMEKFGDLQGMLPEQIWDAADLPAANMRCGYASGSARPLMWAHAEYIKLLRSRVDGVPYDRFPEVAKRYAKGVKQNPPEYWSFYHPTPAIVAGRTLRLCVDASMQLRVSFDRWITFTDVHSSVSYGIHFIDLKIDEKQRDTIQFTMFWPDADRWEGRDFDVAVHG